MDPSATLERIVMSYNDQDWDELHKAANALIAWLDKGGFLPPHVTPNQLMAMLLITRDYGKYNQVATEQKPERDTTLMDNQGRTAHDLP